MPDLPEELAAVVRKLYPTQLLRDADEGGGVRLSFITNNRLYQREVQTGSGTRGQAVTRGRLILNLGETAGFGIRVFQ